MDDFGAAVDAFARLLDYYVDKARRTGEPPSGEVWPEAIQYTAVAFTDESWGGVEKARAYFRGLGGRPYEAEIYKADVAMSFCEPRSWTRVLSS